jgi:hypothetical protein
MNNGTSRFCNFSSFKMIIFIGVSYFIALVYPAPFPLPLKPTQHTHQWHLCDMESILEQGEFHA